MPSFGDRARRAMGRDWDEDRREARDREAARAAADAAFDDDDDGEYADDDAAFDAPVSPRAGARPGDQRRPSTRRERARDHRLTVLEAIREIPDYLRLAWGLLRDGRVAKGDKLLVAAAVLYVVNPFDFIPDVVPFLGQVDDVFLIVLAVQRMISRAGREVVEDHWPGDRAALSDLDLAATVSAAAFFLPGRIKRRLLNTLRFRKQPAR